MNLRFVIFAIALIYGTNALSAQWIELHLGQIEILAETDSHREGVYFAKPTSYASQFSCSKDRYVVIRESKLADRAMSLALYAKSSNLSLKAYVVGCDSKCYLDGRSVMLLDN